MAGLMMTETHLLILLYFHSYVSPYIFIVAILKKNTIQLLATLSILI